MIAVDPQIQEAKDPSGDLMHAGLAEGQMVLLVCGGGASGEEAARRHVEVISGTDSDTCQLAQG